MTVAKNETVVYNWNGDGSSTQFDFDFPIEDESQLIVMHTNSNGKQTTLTYGVDYSINEIGATTGSFITFPLESSEYGILQENEVISNVLYLPIQQDTPYNESDKLVKSRLERNFDYLTRLIAIQKREIDRSVKIQEGAETTPDELMTALMQAKDAAIESANTALNYADFAQTSAQSASEHLEEFEATAATEKAELESIAQEALEARNELVQGNMYKYQLFDTILKDHVLTFEQSKGWALQGTYVYKDAVAGSRYGYPDFYAQCVEEKTAGTATETALGENTVTLYVHANGHVFYDIANKAEVDEFYSAYGAAWFYGVDTENERVFLPRNDWFEQASGDSSRVGKFVEAGLPNIEGNYATNSSFSASSGAFANTKEGAWPSGSSGGSAIHVYFDASLSNPIYGNSTTVQPNAVKKLLYICVGNVEVSTTATNVTQITTSENDTLPRYFSVYSQEDLSTTAAFVKSTGASLTGSLYPSAFADLVARIGEPFAAGTIKSSEDTAITDFDCVVDEDAMTFRLPLLDGSENIIGGAYDDLTLSSSGMTYTAPANGRLVLMKASSAAGQFVQILCNERVTSSVANSGENAACTVEMAKGDTATIYYSAQGEVKRFRFVYNKGNGDLYFKLNNAVTNLDLMDAGAISTALNNKADKDLGNIDISQSFVDSSIGWGIPDFSTGVTWSVTTGATFTAPYDCVVYHTEGFKNRASQYYINGNTTYSIWSRSDGDIWTFRTAIYSLKKGDYITGFTASDAYRQNQFIYYKFSGQSN